MQVNWDKDLEEEAEKQKKKKREPKPGSVMRNVPSIVPNPLPKPVSLSPKLPTNKKPLSTESKHSTDLLGLGKKIILVFYKFYLLIVF